VVTKMILHHLTVLTPAFVCLSVVFYVWLHTQGHPELLNARYQITTTHTHTHTHTLAKAAKTLSHNFSDGCQVCAAEGEKKERSRKCVECYCELALYASQSYLNEAK